MQDARHLAAFAFAMLLFGAAAPADPIEDLYAARGPWDTTTDFDTGPDGDFTLFRPAFPGQNGQGHPVITWGNGTFLTPIFYSAFLDHLASYGYVVIASDDLFTGSGAAMLEGVDWVLAQNENPESPLFNAIDAQRIGAAGHSQGGEGAINAANDARLSCTAAIQPIPGDIAGLNGRLFALAGAEDRIVPAGLVYRDVFQPSTVPTVFGVLDGATHLEPLGDANRFRGYLTAWFAWCLDDDAVASQAFVGACELCADTQWRALRKAGG
jgi:pimeloyl-ACP methyl ester carboxylesterase